MKPLLMILFCALSSVSFAATSFWKNISGGTYSASGNWAGGVPGSAATAVFTNTTSFTVQWSGAATLGNAFFRGTGTITQEIQSTSWTVRTNYLVGDSPTANATIVHRTGTLNVTNSAHTAQLRIGEAGAGNYVLQGGTLNVDSLISTNGAHSEFTFDYGTLRTKEMQLIRTSPPDNPGSFLWIIGTTSNQTSTWVIEGTTTIQSDVEGGTIFLGLGGATEAQANVAVRGPGGNLAIPQTQVGIGIVSERPSVFVVTNGGSVTSSDIGFARATNSAGGHRMVVTGAGSRWSASIITIEDFASILVSDGGSLDTPYADIAGNAANISVTGTNSSLEFSHVLFSGTNSTITISAGATFLTQFITVARPDQSLHVFGGNIEAVDLASYGDLLLDQGRISVTGNLYVSDGFRFRSGILRSLGFSYFETQYFEPPIPIQIGGTATLATMELLGSLGYFNSPLILGSNTTLRIACDRTFTQFLSATNGPSGQVFFERGVWSTAGTEIQLGRPLEVGDGTNAALLQFLGGSHRFADGLVVRTASSVAGTGALSGPITFQPQSSCIFDLRDRVSHQHEPVLTVTGNLAFHGFIALTNFHRFVPARYVLFSYSGSLDVSGAVVTGVPDSFTAELDTSVAGELAIQVRFVGPLPPDYIGNFVLASDATSLSFATSNSVTYSVEYTPSLTPPTWMSFSNVVGTASIISVVDTNPPVGQRYYRLRKLEPP